MTVTAGVLFLQFPSHGKELPCRAWADAPVLDGGQMSVPAIGRPHKASQSFPLHSVQGNENVPSITSLVLPVYHSGKGQEANADLSLQGSIVQSNRLKHSVLLDDQSFSSFVQSGLKATLHELSMCQLTEEEPLQVSMDTLLDISHADMHTGSLMRLGDREGSRAGKKGHDDVTLPNTQLDSRTYDAAIETCSSAGTISGVRLAHVEVIAQGYAGHALVCNALMAMYNKFDNFEEACLVLQRLPNSNLINWNSLITSYSKNGNSIEIGGIYRCMQGIGIVPDDITYAYVLRACYGGAQLEQGRAIHCQILERGIDLSCSSHVGNSLVVMYSNCCCLEGARFVFQSLPDRDVVTWNSMIDGYYKFGFVEASLTLYRDMRQLGVQPTLITFVCALKASSGMQNLQLGHTIHSELIAKGIKLDSIIKNALLDLYCKCGIFEDAQFVFDGLSTKSVITWNTLISGYSLHQCGHLAIQSFKQMQHEGLQPDLITFVCVLKVCSSLFDLQQGRELHSSIVKTGIDMDTVVGNALIAMYGHCCCIDDAQSVFNCTKARDEVTWSALMTGYTHDGRGKEVLQMFKQMHLMGLNLDEAVFVCVLKACGQVAALEQGMELHAYMLEKGYDGNASISSSLISMYGKCGYLDMATLVFNRLAKRSVVSYNAMLAIFGDHGESRMFQLYHSMTHAGMKPNSITFTCLLSACKNMDLVDEGCCFFMSMQRFYGVFPEMEHYGCMVDLFGKTGHGNAAEDLIETVPVASNIVCWTSLLSSCKKHSDLPLGRRCFNYAIRIDPTNTSVYVLMSKLYKVAGFFKDAMKIEGLRKQRNRWKRPGKAFVEVNKETYEFVVGDKTHPRFEEIDFKARDLGRTAEKDFLQQSKLSDLQEDVSDNLCGHSEKLAIAFGLLSTNSGTTIRVAKNIRMCADCHTTAKLTSAIESRQIVVSDSYCVHNFREGLCSCKD